MKIRLTQIDGSLPNLALMKLAHWHKAQGHEVTVTRELGRSIFEPDYDRVYGSAIFQFSVDRVRRFQQEWPSAIVGGTGTMTSQTVESMIGEQEYEHYDYAGWPDFKESIGFTQRGCRLKCKFCVVPQKEGKPKSVNTIQSIWRGGKYPKKLHILDNDFFGQPRAEWEARVEEMQAGFRVCLSQGINVRLIDSDAAKALASIQYRNTKFNKRCLYTAWDNLGDEKIFLSGVEKLAVAGVPPKHLMAYMLIGFDILETWERIWYRFNRMVALGIKPYPMVYDRSRKDLVAFQRWVVTGLYRIVPWEEYRRQTKSLASMEGLQSLTARLDNPF